MNDLYVSRKGNGDLHIEISSLKQDNERLLSLLKDTCEYADFSDTQIFKAAGRTKTAFNDITSTSSKGSDKAGKKGKKENDWIPTEAVRAILRIRDEFKGNMSETCIS